MATRKTDNSISEKTEQQPAAAVDKIRDLLFGVQMNDYDQRFHDLENKIGSATEKLISEINSRVSGLETFIKQEVSALKQQDKEEGSERIHAFNELSKDLKNSTDSLTHDFASQLGSEVNALQKSIQEQSTEMATRLDEVNNQLTSLLSKETSRLHDIKVNRGDLAKLFSELSERISSA